MYFFKTLALTSAVALTAEATIPGVSVVNTLRKHQNKRYDVGRKAQPPAFASVPVPALDSAVLARSSSKPAYLTDKSKKFAVDGAALPGIPFDVGESYAGLLPISDKKDEERQLYFWFFPSEDPKASDEITIWLNGGPGCSSLLGLLTENGPLIWPSGTDAPVKNPYSWSRLTNVVWIEQPAGTGFSPGKSDINDELGVAREFAGFWKNFVDTFGLKGRKVYLTGESYAGMYVPYIANNFLESNNTDYYNVKGIAINDPVIGDGTLQFEFPVPGIVEHWSNLLGLNHSTINEIHHLANKGGYTKYINDNFRFPPPPHPWNDASVRPQGIQDVLVDALGELNPCFNIYHFTDTCPYVSDHVESYFNRKDVQKAIHAPSVEWSECGGDVFIGQDQSPGPALDGTLANIVAKTHNVIIGSGALDFLLATNGTLFALQNTTWGGAQGFHEYPSTPFFVPEHQDDNAGALGGTGNLGIWRKERGLTFYEILLAGHEVPGYAASAGYRVLQGLLGRIPDYSSGAPLF